MPDRPAAVPSVGGSKKAEAGRCEQAAGDALKDAAGDEHLLTGRDPAEHRGESEPDRANDEHVPPAEAIAERAADEVERCQRQGVREDDPLLTSEADAEIAFDRRQRDIDDGGVHERHRGARDGRKENEPARPDRASLRSA